MKLAPVLGAVLALAVSHPSIAAVTGDCLWAALPLKAKDRIILTYANGGRAAVDKLEPIIDLASAAACDGGLTSGESALRTLATQTGQLMSVVPLEWGSREALAARGYSPATLEAAWISLGPKGRELLRGAGEALKRDQSMTDADLRKVAEAVLDAAQAAGWSPTTSPPDEMQLFLDHFGARGIREGLEETN